VFNPCFRKISIVRHLIFYLEIPVQSPINQASEKKIKMTRRLAVTQKTKVEIYDKRK